MASASRYAEEGAEAGFEFPFDGETRTWAVKDVKTDKIVSEGHKSMGQAYRSVMEQPEPEPEPEKKKSRGRAKQAAH
jgi:hypothetical protein